MTTLRFLAGFVVLYGVLAGPAELDSSGRYGIGILAAVLLTGLVVERLLARVRPAVALRLLGFGRPDPQVVLRAVVVGVLVLGVYPVVTVVTGASFTLVSGWPWLLIGVFAFHGLAEELVWRGYAFRRLRARRTFAGAVVATMPLMALTHLPVVLRSGLVVGLVAMLVAALTSLPLAHLFEAGRNTIWAPAIVHTAIDSFKLVVVPDEVSMVFSLTLAAVSVTVPMLAFLPFRTRPARRSTDVTHARH
jgi:membrane protease YdiL (CAAX protease family)